MKRLISTSFVITIVVLSGVLNNSAFAQTEEEFQQEFQQYFETHDQSEWQAYVLARLAGMTTNALAEELAWSLLENSFTSSPCLGVKRQLCDSEYEQKMAEVSALTAAGAAACLLAAVPAGPLVSATCFGAVAFQHATRLSAASKAHRACYLKARLECLPVSPPPCSTRAAADGGGKYSVGGPLAVECDWSDDCDCQERSPILVDVAGNGFNLTDLDHGVRFDITGSLGPEPLSWTRANSDDAFLALDLNANGAIDNGKELLGNFSAQLAPEPGEERNGFRALELFDTNRDGIINNQDGVYSELRLWQDKNHNAVSEPDELHSLEFLGLRSLELKHNRFTKTDEFGNEFRYRAKVRDGKGAQLGRWAWDVFLVSALRNRTTLERFLWEEK